MHAQTRSGDISLGAAGGGAFFRGADDDFAFCEDIQGSAELSDADDLLVLVPAIAAVIPGMELTAKLALVPILNAGLLCKELVTGTYHWKYIALIFGVQHRSTRGIALFLAVKMFQRESVLFSS